MGLDMMLKSIRRDVFYSVDRDDFWEVEFPESKELIYWRKEYDIAGWFRENLKFYEEYTEEITKEKLIKFSEFLKTMDKEVYVEEVNKLIKENNFDDNVIYYTYCS